MYHALLTRRYVRSKVMPLLAAAAVMLCSAMVLIVWSVMGGFLDMLLASGKSMIGDVSIEWPIAYGGVPYYEEVLEELALEPSVAAATPMLESFALLGLPGGESGPCLVLGIDPDGYDAVTGFGERLYWRPLEGEALATAQRDKEFEDERVRSGSAEERRIYDQRIFFTDDQLVRDGRSLTETHPGTGEVLDAVVPGIAVYKLNKRTRGGFINPLGSFLPWNEVEITVMPRSDKGKPINLDLAESRSFPVANEFSSGLYEADANWVLMPLDELQEMLKVNAAGRVAVNSRPVVERDEHGVERIVQPPIVAPEPARVSHILIKAAAGVTPEALQPIVERVYQNVFDRHPADMVDPGVVAIYTWEHKPGLDRYIAAVKRETVMVVSLFCVISSVASFMIFSIFWSMVSEKTRDIGVLRALGASRGGVAWLFLRYGLVIGVIGASLGLLLAWLFISNINAIHGFMATVLGIEIWSPETYMFTEIPSDMDSMKVAAVAAGAVVFSLIGALLPAWRASRMDPVKALRFE